METAKRVYNEPKVVYNEQYERWMPWIEDQYLRLFGKDNKASYATKQELDKTKVTGIEQVDNVQDGVNNLVSGQVGKGGLLQPVGDFASKEGINRAERGGKDDAGNYGVGPLNSVADPVAKGAKTGASSVSQGAQGAAGYVSGGVKSAGGYIGSFWGGKKGEQKPEQK